MTADGVFAGPDRRVAVLLTTVVSWRQAGWRNLQGFLRIFGGGESQFFGSVAGGGSEVSGLRCHERIHDDLSQPAESSDLPLLANATDQTTAR